MPRIPSQYPSDDRKTGRIGSRVSTYSIPSSGDARKEYERKLSQPSQLTRNPERATISATHAPHSSGVHSRSPNREEENPVDDGEGGKQQIITRSAKIPRQFPIFFSHPLSSIPTTPFPPPNHNTPRPPPKSISHRQRYQLPFATNHTLRSRVMPAMLLHAPSPNRKSLRPL